MLRDFKELIAWQRAYSLTLTTYAVTRKFPVDERFGLTAQMRRAAVSVSSNIAEGYGRDRTPDYVRFLWISHGSLCELETQVRLSIDLGFGDAERMSALLEQIEEVSRVLRALTRSLDHSSTLRRSSLPSAPAPLRPSAPGNA